jgi:heterodisulfide reductase subunit C
MGHYRRPQPARVPSMGSSGSPRTSGILTLHGLCPLCPHCGTCTAGTTRARRSLALPPR